MRNQIRNFGGGKDRKENVMKENKIKEIIGKVGKFTLPAMMLMGGVWNSNFTALSATELGIRANEAEKTQPIVEVVDHEDFEKILATSWNFDGSCSGCEGSCGGCTGGCTGCSGGCTVGCTGCMGTCEGTATSW
jgi:hypothetical protein